MPWLQHSLVNLASKRPDLYSMTPLEPGSAWPGGNAAVYVCMSGNRIAQPASVLSNPTVRAWIEAGAPVVFDDSGEAGLSWAGQWADLRASLDALNLPPCRLIWIAQNENGADLCEQAFRDNPAIRATSVVLHYWMHKAHADFKPLPRKPRTARFINLNHKLRAHRQAIVGRLILDGLIDRGIVSMVEADCACVADWLPRFGAEIEAAHKALAGRAGQLASLEQHAEAGFSIVAETEMTHGHMRRFTEKTLYPLAHGMPFVVAGNPGTLSLLRSIGFRTFEPFISEHYDEIRDPRERLACALDVATGLATLSEPDFDKLLSQLQPILDHNADHFRNGLPEIMERQHAAVRSAVSQINAR